MAHKRNRKSLTSSAERASSAFQQVMHDLESPDDFTRAEAVRSLCPCRSAWGVPIQRYVSAMREDPSSSVRHEVHHVLDEDSGLGKRLEMRSLQEEKEAAWEELPGPHSLAWRKRRKPLQKGRPTPPRRKLQLPIR